GLVEDGGAAEHGVAPVVGRAPEARPVEEDVALGGADQPDEVSEQRALPAAAASHDDEDLPARHVEGEVALDDEVAVGHGQVGYPDAGLRYVGHARSRWRHRPP